jgi:hypothetical protein
MTLDRRAVPPGPRIHDGVGHVLRGDPLPGPLALILFSVAGYLMESDAIAEYLFDAAALRLP